MLDSLRNFFAEFASGSADLARFQDNDYRLAAAALLIHVVTVDGRETADEHAKLRQVLKAGFALDDAATEALIVAAIAADRDAIDLYQFTSLLNRALDEAGRRRIVEMMWQLVYADGRVSELEDNLIWRAADLLGLTSRERIELRQRVAGTKADDQ